MEPLPEPASSFESLPDHLLELVLALLPAVPLLRCSVLCKRLRGVVLGEPALRARLRSLEGVLPQGRELRPAESVRSPSGRVRFVYQTDANLVLYVEAEERERPVWALQTVNAPFGHGVPGSASLGRDGRLTASFAHLYIEPRLPFEARRRRAACRACAPARCDSNGLRTASALRIHGGQEGRAS